MERASILNTHIMFLDPDLDYLQIRILEYPFYPSAATHFASLDLREGP